MSEGATRTTDDDLRRRLVVPVGMVVTAVWAASAFFGLLTEDFLGLEVVSPLMGIFVGYVFGIKILPSGERPPMRRQADGAESPPTRRRRQSS